MKTAVITGGTRGIGKSISEMYLKKGYNIIVNYASCEIGKEKFLEDNKEFINKIKIIKEDLSNVEGLDRFVKKIEGYNINIDAIVLNVGITKREEFEDITYESWSRVFDTNLTIPFFLLQKLYKNLNENSHIVFISSVLGIKADGTSMQYGVSKGAMVPMIKYLAKKFSEKKITVNGIAPGFIDTDWQNLKSEEQKVRIKNKTLLNRFGNVSEISSVCEMLEENEYITGQLIVVDGGYSIY